MTAIQEPRRPGTAEQAIFAVLSLALAGLAIMFAVAAHDEYDEYIRYRDFNQWLQSPGKLESLRLRQVSNKSQRPYRIDCEYTFEHSGRVQTGRVFDLDDRLYATAEDAKAVVHAILPAIDPGKWKPASRDPFIDWTYDTAEARITVRHSASDAGASTLTANTPRPGWTHWLLIIMFGFFALLLGLAAPAMIAAIFLKTSHPGPPRSINP